MRYEFYNTLKKTIGDWTYEVEERPIKFNIEGKPSEYEYYIKRWQKVLWFFKTTEYLYPFKDTMDVTVTSRPEYPFTPKRVKSAFIHFTRHINSYSVKRPYYGFSDY